MFKLTVIGAVMVAAASAAVFQDKMAVKSLQTRGHFNANITDPSEYLEEWAEFIEDEIQDQSEILRDEAVAQKNELVRELMECYDVDGDGALNTTEFDRYVVDSLTGRNGPCPSYVAPPSLELSSYQSQTLLNWVNGTNMTRIYNFVSGTFNKGSFEQIVGGYSSLFVIGQTQDGGVFGGYLNTTYPGYETQTWISDSSMFIFNMNLYSKWTTSYSSSNVWINTYDYYDDIIDFGWHNALQFEACGANVCARYTPSNDFYNEPSNVELGVSSSNVVLNSFQVYKVWY